MAINRYGNIAPPAAPGTQVDPRLRAQRRQAMSQALGPQGGAIRTASAAGGPPPASPPPLQASSARLQGQTTAAGALPGGAPLPPVASRTVAPGTPGAATAPPPAPSSPMSELARLKQEQAQARAAADAEMQSSKAKALLDARAKMNLSGGGFSGAGAALEGDIARTQDRSRILALSDLDQKQHEEQMQRLRDDTDLYDAEDAEGADIDGDGVVGRPGAPADAAARHDEQNRQTIADMQAANQTKDVFWGDTDTPDGQGGTQEEPFAVTQAEYNKLNRDGFKLKHFTYTDLWGQSVSEYVDQYGKHYVVTGGG